MILADASCQKIPSMAVSLQLVKKVEPFQVGHAIALRTTHSHFTTYFLCVTLEPLLSRIQETARPWVQVSKETFV